MKSKKKDRVTIKKTNRNDEKNKSMRRKNKTRQKKK